MSPAYVLLDPIRRGSLHSHPWRDLRVGDWLDTKLTLLICYEKKQVGLECRGFWNRLGAGG